MSKFLFNYNEVEKFKMTARKKNSLFKKYVGEFTYERIDPVSVPMNKFIYNLRGFDYNGLPLSIEPYVKCDFSGSFITEKKIRFPNKFDKYIEITHVIINEEDEF